MAPGGLPAADVGGDDPVAAYAEASAAALAGAGAGDALTRVHATPLRDMPGPVLRLASVAYLTLSDSNMGKISFAKRST